MNLSKFTEKLQPLKPYWSAFSQTVFYPYHDLKARKDQSQQLTRVQNLLKRITYKQSTTFYAESLTKYDNVGCRAISIIVKQQTIDQRNGINQPVQISWSEDVTELKASTDIKILHAIRKKVHELELHEADEFFKFDHKHVEDPHPEKKKK
jgi:hypothetical protein